MEPVTVVVRRQVRPGCEGDYEAWLERLIASSRSLPGYLGTEVLRPSSPHSREYTSIFRFDSSENLRAFEESDLRRHALQEVGAFVEADATWERLSGLELWFTPPPGLVVPQPSRFRMALLLIVVVYTLVFSIGTLVGWVLESASGPLRLLVTIVLEVFTLTYVIMPRLTRVLARWIYPQVNKGKLTGRSP
jgi:hypothetical protein